MSKFYTHAHLYRGKILVRGYDNGKRFHYQDSYEPYLFIPSRTEPKSKYKTVLNSSLSRVDFSSIVEARNFVREYDNIENFKIYGSTDFLYTYLYDNFSGNIEFDTKTISIGCLDIETDKQKGGINPTNPNAQITAISLRKNGTCYSFGYGEYKPHKPNIFYKQCANELELLEEFIKLWEILDLDIITGWHVEFFDMPYLINRIILLKGQEAAARLSPWRMLDEKMITIRGKDNQVYTPLGITILDYEHLYKKFSYENSEDWKLNTIAHKELKVKKIDYSEYEDLFELYVRNFQKFMEYNITDVELVDALEEKCKFIELVLYMAYDAKVNYSDTLGTVKLWDVIIHNELMDHNVCVPQKETKHMPKELIGGYVKEVKPGMYKWVVSFDFDSLYPHIIMLLNIGPDTYFGKGYHSSWSIDLAMRGDFNRVTYPDGYGDLDLALGANLTLFRKDSQSFLSKLMQTKYEDRQRFKSMSKDFKKRAKETEDQSLKRKYEYEASKYHNLQLARKIQLNSCYGALTNLWFRWFDFDSAEAITMTGQFATKTVEKHINDYLNRVLKTSGVDRVVACDTDSVYVTLDDLVARVFPDGADDDKIVEFIDKVCKTKLKEVIEEACQSVYDQLNVHMQALKMKRETIANKGMWVAAKNYMLNAYDIEGERFKEPVLKVTGIKAVMPSTPAIVRTAMKETFSIMMNEGQDKLHEYIASFREEFNGKPFDIVAMPRGVNGIEKYQDSSSIYKNATPIHVRASLMYNWMLRSKGIEEDYEQIYSGDKIKYCYLKMPNPTRENVIAVLNNLPPELGLSEYVDYEKQFAKTYLDPLNTILSVIGWTTEKKATLDSFF